MVVNPLLQAEANTNGGSTNQSSSENGRTTLVAAGGGHLEVVRSLLGLGASLTEDD